MGPIVVMALGMLALASTPSMCSSSPKIGISGIPECKRDPYPWVNFVVQSYEAAALSFSRRELPWNPNGPCVVIGYDMASGRTLERMHPIDDDWELQPSVVLGPKEAVKGSLPVLLSYAKESPKGEVIVFWTCRVVAQGREPSKRVGGWFSFDRREVPCRIGTSNNEMQRTKPAQAMELRR